MSKHKAYKQQQHKRYRTEVLGRSIFDGSPTLTVDRYRVPRTYEDAVKDVITAFKSGIPFNRAVDQVATLEQGRVNRDKLSEHTLKCIANDY